MANNKSAAKRALIAERNRLLNKSYKSAVATLTKNYLRAVANYQSNPSDESKEEVAQRLSLAYSKIDRAVKKGILHRNTGDRRKAILAKAIRSGSQEVHGT